MSASRSGFPPTLVRQGDRKLNFVDGLVDSATHIVEAIWPTSSVACRTETFNNGILPLRTFIQETLRRSRTSYSTLQVALYYLVLIKPHIPACDFTMEQPDDCHAIRALQCGRRMFLAALILASKYLQDRNFSTRAWSKISGLNTQEINQNEMAFVEAVHWKLHITEEVYNRWTDCVMSCTPGQPPSPGGVSSRGSSGTTQPQLLDKQVEAFKLQCEAFKSIILKLTPELENLDDLLPWRSSSVRGATTRSPQSMVSQEQPYSLRGSDVPPTSRFCGTLSVLEPVPASAYAPGRLVPALGLLPTPRLTPQRGGFNTPAVSAVSSLLGRSSSMSFAMAQASTACASQTLDRWSVSTQSSPHNHFAVRRSSLANTISTASSPESMISDSSRTSRSSSISSASSLVSAPLVKPDFQARYQHAKPYSERLQLRPIIASVPEDYEVNGIMTASPESYTGPVGKDLGDMSMDTPLARRMRDMDNTTRESVSDAARALQALQSYRNGTYAAYATAQQSSAAAPAASVIRKGCKRSRPVSMENPLQENVREILAERGGNGEALWSDTLVRSRFGAGAPGAPCQVPIRATVESGRKRVCCSAEAAECFTISHLHPAVGGLGGPGMWEGILN